VDLAEIPWATAASAQTTIMAIAAAASANPTALTGDEAQPRMRPTGDCPFTADHSRVCRNGRALRPVRKPPWSSLEE